MQYVPWVAAVVIYAALLFLVYRRRCKHELIICLHGDEIVSRNFNRSVCIICEKPFKELPEICAYTGKPHLSSEREEIS